MSDFRLDFTGIGIAKSGTTWIANALGEHPSVCMAWGKETNFFLTRHPSEDLPVRRRFYGQSHHEEGMGWYEKLFAHHRAGQLRGEFSNAYISDPESARLLQEHNPEVKLLCCFRNPVEMIYAAYYQLSRVQPLPATFEETLQKYPRFLDYGRYRENLQPFLDRFPRERFHFMLHDDMKADAAGLYRGLCEFLGIDPGFRPEVLNRRVNPRRVLRYRWIRDLRCRISGVMGSSAAMRSVRKGLFQLGVGGLVVRAFRLNERPGTVPPLNPETRARLVAVYREGNERLGELLGRDLSHWNA